jgi:hypothetical protein
MALCSPTEAACYKVQGNQSILTTQLRFRLNEADVIFERFDEELIAIQMGTGSYHSVCGAGIDAFLLLPLEPTVPEMAQTLTQKYEASPERIVEDLGPFFDQLVAESLVIGYPAGERAGKALNLSHSGPRVPYIPPAVQPFRDLQGLFLIDPVHDVGPAGWPQAKPDPDFSTLLNELRYRLKNSASMIFERFDEETVAINLGTGAYHSLSGPAEDIFLLLAERPTRSEVIQALRTKYAASEREISEPVAKFLNSLILTGLAEQEEFDAETSEPPPVRPLTLLKPGEGLPFAVPDLDTYHDRRAAQPLLLETQVQQQLELALKRYRLRHPEVLFRMAGGDAVVINVDRGQYYRLNMSAAIVFRLLDQQPTASELVIALTHLYNVDRRELTAAVLILLRNLTQEGLVAAEGGGDGSRVLETAGIKPDQYEPFVVEAYRELHSLFLLFPTAEGQRPAAGSSARELASLLKGYHEEVASRFGVTEAVYRIAGHNVRIRCAGGMRISELGLAFEHLKAEPSVHGFEGLTIQVWDGVSGGPPSHPFLASYLADFFPNWCKACGPRGEVVAFHSRELPVLYHAGPDILSVIDTENRTAYYLKRDEAPVPYWEIGSPFRSILHFWFSGQGVQFVHGGAVAGPNGGVLLAGKGGSGKSTAALACLNAGMSYAGDDYCAMEMAAAPYLHSLYNTAKLKGPEDLDRFPHLRDRVWNPNCFANNTGDKATIFLSQWWPDRMSSGFPLRAILIPRITGQNATELGECSEIQALMALSPSTVALLPMSGQEDLERMGDLVSKLPRYMLYVGTDVAQIPKVIQSIL